jgi:hypothetical protein
MLPPAKVPEEVKGTLNVLPAQKGLPVIVPVVIELVTFVIPSILMSSIEKAGSAAANSLELF